MMSGSVEIANNYVKFNLVNLLIRYLTPHELKSINVHDYWQAKRCKDTVLDRHDGAAP